MTINKAMEQADKLRPNCCPAEEKARWLKELDDRLAAETVGTPAAAETEGAAEAAETVETEQGDGWDAELVAKAPYDGLYVLYLAAMLDFWNQEYDHYANSMEMFNAAAGEWQRAYRRAHTPEKEGAWKL